MFKINRARRSGVGPSGAGAGGGRSRKGRVSRPGLEALESRRLLATVSEFPIRNFGGPSDDLALATDGSIWITMPSSNNVGRFTPASPGSIGQYRIPTPNSGAGRIINGPDNKLWFVETAYDQFGVIDPATGVVNEVPVLPARSPGIHGLAAGPDNNIWFTESSANKIGVINPTTHAVAEFAVPTANAMPYGITKGADGNLWFTEYNTNKIGRISPTTHVITEFVVSSSTVPQLREIATGPGGNLYYAMPGVHEIGMINPTTPIPRVFDDPSSSPINPLDVTGGPDGRVWFTESSPHQDDIGALNVTTGVITIYPPGLVSAGAPHGIVSGNNDGNLYATSASSGGVIRIKSSSGPDLINTTYALSSVAPGSVQADVNGKLWFVEAGSLLRTFIPATRGNSVAFLPLSSTGYQPAQITVNTSDGSLWFTENGPNGELKVGKVASNGTITDIPAGPTNGVNAQGIAYDSKNGLFYVAEFAGNRLATVNPANGSITETLPALATGSNPFGVAVDTSGRVWFTENGTNKVGVVDPSAPQSVTEITLPAGASPKGIVLGNDGNLWVVETAGTSRGVAVINPSTMRVIQQVVAPGANGGITVGLDGVIWFTENAGVGRIDPATFQLTDNATPNATPQGVAADKDGNIYFTASGVGSSPNVIGSVNLAPYATPTLVDITAAPPPNVAVGQGFGLIVEVDYAVNQVDAFYNGPVTIQLASNPGAATLSGNLTATAVNGLAFFPGLTLNRPDFGYTIRASIPGLSAVTVSDGTKTDFDGDGKVDPAVFGKDPVTGEYRFKVVTSSSGLDSAHPLIFNNGGAGFGNAQSIPVPADYFGDGRSAYALFYPNNLGGMTFTAVSSVNNRSLSVDFGGTRDIPVVADVDGDGKADFGVYGYDPHYGYRFDFLLSTKNFDINQQFLFNNGNGFGNAQSVPVVGDFDGSGKAGFGLFVPEATGSFFTYISQTGSSFTRTIGGPNDIASAVQYDGDGKADLSLYGPDPANPSHERYTVLTSGSGYDPSKAIFFDNYGNGYGNVQSVPVVADFEGTGKADFALFIPDYRGGMGDIYQTSQTGAGVFVDFATLTDLPLSAPTYLNARKVRGY